MARMQRVVVREFGGPEMMEVVEEPAPEPGAGQVRVRIMSIGLNHAELMARRGEYRIASGEPPFTPGLEGGGVIDAVGAGVAQDRLGQRVTLSVEAPRSGGGGTYRTHFVCASAQAIAVPDAVPDEQLGALWLSYLTAWGCLIWKQQLQPGQIVAIPAASSSVGLAAAQIVRQAGARAIGLTTSIEKVDVVMNLPANGFERVIVTRDQPWRNELKQLTSGHGVDVFFDPVAAGDYLNEEIRTLAQGGTIWVYGLLGSPGVVDVSPLIRKQASIRGWILSELAAVGGDALQQGYQAVLNGWQTGVFQQHTDRVFDLAQVREAHAYMERGRHVGKLVLRA